jgi:hypothetical protein
MHRDDRPGLVTWRAALGASLTLETAGALVAIFLWVPVGVILLVIGFLLQWRSLIARNEARWHQWEDRDGSDPP